jgi:hypothetical protein
LMVRRLVGSQAIGDSIAAAYILDARARSRL